MPDSPNLVPAAQMAATNEIHYPNETREYRAARNALLAEEIELRRHIERVADQRRALPAGAPSRKTSTSSPNPAPRPSPASSATRTRSSSTA